MVLQLAVVAALYNALFEIAMLREQNSDRIGVYMNNVCEIVYHVVVCATKICVCAALCQLVADFASQNSCAPKF